MRGGVRWLSRFLRDLPVRPRAQVTHARCSRTAVPLLLCFALVLPGCSRSASEGRSGADALPKRTEHVAFESHGLKLHGFLLTPEGAGPFPAILYNHGSAAGTASNVAFTNIAPRFAARGWAFFMPYRRGQGTSAAAGAYVMDEIAAAREKGGAAAAAAKQLLLLETDHLDDQLSAMAWLQRDPRVDVGRIAVAGNSFGGIEAVLGVERAAYCAAIDAAGAAESWSKSQSLRDRMMSAVRGARAPIFFFQAENDFDVSPTHALFDEMKRVGKAAEMKIYPAFGVTPREGHSFPYAGVDGWFEDALRFLEQGCKGAVPTPP